jgi:endo-1,4-beta-xylanase
MRKSPLRRYRISSCLALLTFVSIPAAALADATPQPFTVTLWPAGSPTLQGANEKEETVPPDPKPGERVNSIKNVHNPLLQVHPPPPDESNGTVVIVAPGGGHSMLVWGTEGLDIAAWLNNHGITVVLLKYRLAQTPGYRYTVEGEAFQDMQRAIRTVRAKAREWGVDPHRVGVLGFSAGGALTALANTRFDRGKPDPTDPINRESSRPDFVGLVYPGWSPRMTLTVPKDAAPAFLTSAGLDDASHARQSVEFYDALFKAGVPVELHIYARGGHGGGIHGRRGAPFGTWHHRFVDWLRDLGYLK